MSVHLLSLNDFNHLLKSIGISIFEEEDTTGVLPFSFMSQVKPKLTGRYHLLLKSNISENMAGISNDKINQYYVPWELVGEKDKNEKEYFVFKGWGDTSSGGNTQFEGITIGIEKSIFIIYLKKLIKENSEYMSLNKMSKVIGLEKIDLK